MYSSLVDVGYEQSLEIMALQNIYSHIIERDAAYNTTSLNPIHIKRLALAIPDKRHSPHGKFNIQVQKGHP